MNAIQSAVYTLIQRFVKRQAIVLDALRDLRPDLIMRVENRNNPEFWDQWTQETWLVFVRKHARQSTGEWGENNEWEYFLHGPGCRLTHKVTQERLEWDLGSLRRFDKNWFVGYLLSLLDQNNDDKVLATIRNWYDDQEIPNPKNEPVCYLWRKAIFPILEQLHEMGLLSQKSEVSYALLTRDQSSGLNSDRSSKS